jgi:hypothetical protein
MSIIKTNEITIKEFIGEIDEIYYDPSFQRPAGCWNKKNSNGYIQSVFLGYASTPVVVANIERCRKFSLKKEDEESEQYYAKHSKRGYTYISLDGQHRALCLESFVNNKETYSGKVLDDDGNEIIVRNKFFKDLPEEFKISFRNKKIVLQAFERALRADLPLIFKSQNSNSSLTDQQFRNAVQTPLASWTRNLANKHMEMFTKIFPKNNFPKMQPHEFISKFFMHATDCKNDVGKKSLDAFYQKGEGEKFENTYSISAKKKTESILSTLNIVWRGLNKTKISSSKNLLPVLLVLDKLHDEPGAYGPIEDSDKFVNAVQAADLELINASKEQEVLDTKSGKTVPTISYYHEKCRINWGSHVRSDRQKELFNKFRDLVRLKKAA